jgi:hypothetical protein
MRVGLTMRWALGTLRALPRRWVGKRMKDRFNNAVGPQVRARKTGPGHVVPALAALSLGSGLQTATQSFAGQYDRHPELTHGKNRGRMKAPQPAATCCCQFLRLAKAVI